MQCIAYFNGYEIKDKLSREQIAELTKQTANNINNLTQQTNNNINALDKKFADALLEYIPTTIKEQNYGVNITFWLGTTDEYNMIKEKVQNCFYIVTDDQSLEVIKADITTLSERVKTLEETDTEEIFDGWLLENGELGNGDSASIERLGNSPLLLVHLKCNDELTGEVDVDVILRGEINRIVDQTFNTYYDAVSYFGSVVGCMKIFSTSSASDKYVLATYNVELAGIIPPDSDVCNINRISITQYNSDGSSGDDFTTSNAKISSIYLI